MSINHEEHKERESLSILPICLGFVLFVFFVAKTLAYLTH
jgi:hypothetical protein